MTKVTSEHVAKEILSVQNLTPLVAGSSVVQVILAVVSVMSVTVTSEITGAVVSGGGKVVKVSSSDVAAFPLASLDFTQ
jgi:hypothetical protein